MPNLKLPWNLTAVGKNTFSRRYVKKKYYFDNMSIGMEIKRIIDCACPCSDILKKRKNDRESVCVYQVQL